MAVFRDLVKILPPQKDDAYHIVVTNRFYTSVQLALQLLACNIYCVGTVQINKKEFTPTLVTGTAPQPEGTCNGFT
ncbi:hypothetical protein P3T76_011877 [Phytophthora citrophthora]|uniref:PiggyBac transposable element-derived protein domain-containing protein n=1 Tax=Phytophthora citrophthora TaxID=4793 RepID=A0AAD9G8C1_9STRA|nr:hypothetical protein P3T76_011877 [Phytophthora citrophthora]